MSIFGVTHQEDGTPIQRLARAYKVSIGIPASDDKKYPQKSDHFHIRAKNANGDWVDDVVFAEKLREIYMPVVQTDKGNVRPPLREFDIVFLSDNLDEVFKTELAWWATSEKKCSGDGRKAMRSITALSKEELKEHEGEGDRWVPWTPCGEGCPDLEAGRCHPSGQLFFIFKDRPIMGSVAEYTTTSYETVRRIHSSLLQIQSVTGGRLRGIPFKIVVRPGKTRYEGTDGKPKTGTAYFVNIEFRQEDYSKLVPTLLQQSVQYDLALGAQRRMLTESVDEEDDPFTIAEVHEQERAKEMTSEFQPENRTEIAAAATAEDIPQLSKIRSLCSELGLNKAQEDTLFSVLKGDMDEIERWIQTLVNWSRKDGNGKAKALEIFTKAVTQPESLGKLTAEAPKEQPAATTVKRDRKASKPEPTTQAASPPQQQTATAQPAASPPTDQTQERPKNLRASWTF